MGRDPLRQCVHGIPESVRDVEADADGPGGARAGDALCLELVDHEAQWLGLGIVNLLHLYSPSAVVLGGGVSDGFELLRPGIEQQIRQRALPAFRAVPVVKAALGQDSGLIGAASLTMLGERTG